MPKNSSAFKGVSSYTVSQNFLTSARTIDRVLDLTTIGRADDVWEIGPGKGHITRRLLPRCGRLTAVEIDPALYRRLQETLGDRDNLRLIRRDFLAQPLPASGAYKVFSNTPFHITTRVLQRLTGAPNPPEDCWLILEKGAAMRFAGRPFPALHSLRIAPFFEPRLHACLRREDFHPMPRVEVRLLHLHRRETPDLPWSERSRWTAFLRGMHGPPAHAPLRPGQIRKILQGKDIPQSATMSYVQWLCLFRATARDRNPEGFRSEEGHHRPEGR